MFKDLLGDLISGIVNPESRPNMTLELEEISGRFYSNDNRRLFVLKMFREEAVRDHNVQCKVFPRHSAYERYQESYGERRAAVPSESDGLRVRMAPRVASRAGCTIPSY